jgi:phosphoribosylanthranilate isomerase
VGPFEAKVSKLSPFVDAFITDTFDPRTGASGATGKTHDWRVSRRLVEISARPVILAGSLTPENVTRAILEVRRAGVDSHTDVEDSRRRKSREKVQNSWQKRVKDSRPLRQSRRGSIQAGSRREGFSLCVSRFGGPSD